MNSTWKPDSKIVAAAIAAIVAWLLQLVLGIDVPPGIEAALAVVVAYFVPSTAGRPLKREGVGLPAPTVFKREDGHLGVNGAIQLLIVAILLVVLVKLLVGL